MFIGSLVVGGIVGWALLGGWVGAVAGIVGGWVALFILCLIIAGLVKIANRE